MIATSLFFTFDGTATTAHIVFPNETISIPIDPNTTATTDNFFDDPIHRLAVCEMPQMTKALNDDWKIWDEFLWQKLYKHQRQPILNPKPSTRPQRGFKNLNRRFAPRFWTGRNFKKV